MKLARPLCWLLGIVLGALAAYLWQEANATAETCLFENMKHLPGSLADDVADYCVQKYG